MPVFLRQSGSYRPPTAFSHPHPPSHELPPYGQTYILFCSLAENKPRPRTNPKKNIRKNSDGLNRQRSSLGRWTDGLSLSNGCAVFVCPAQPSLNQNGSISSAISNSSASCSALPRKYAQIAPSGGPSAMGRSRPPHLPERRPLYPLFCCKTPSTEISRNIDSSRCLSQ